MPNETTTQQARAAMELMRAVAETIREMGPEGAPSGVVYSALMGFGVSLSTYTTIVSKLVEWGFVKQVNNVLYWQER